MTDRSFGCHSLKWVDDIDSYRSYAQRDRTNYSYLLLIFYNFLMLLRLEKTLSISAILSITILLLFNYCALFQNATCITYVQLYIDVHVLYIHTVQYTVQGVDISWEQLVQMNRIRWGGGGGGCHLISPLHEFPPASST